MSVRRPPFRVDGVPPDENWTFQPLEGSGILVPVRRIRGGLPSDLPDWQRSVAIDTSGGPVSISGDVTATISAGTVTIANASIAVINAPGTKITSARPPKELAVLFVDHTGNTAFPTLDSDVQALVIQLGFPLASYQHLKVAWVPTGANTIAWVPLEVFEFSQNVFVVPILPTTRDTGDVQTGQLAITLQATAGQFANAIITEVFDSAPLWMQIFPLPQIEPNQTPLLAQKTLAANVGQWLIAPQANVRIVLFGVTFTATSNFGASDAVYVGHNPTLPTMARPNLLIAAIPNTGFPATAPWPYAFSGSVLPAGDGLYAVCDLSAAGNLNALIAYSLM